MQNPGAEMRRGKEGVCAEWSDTQQGELNGSCREPVMRGLDPRIYLLSSQEVFAKIDGLPGQARQ
jgi:hypothetical protein